MSFVEVMTDVFEPLFGFFNSLLGSIFLFGLMLMLLMLSLMLLGRSRRKRAMAATATPIEPTIEAGDPGLGEGAPANATAPPPDLQADDGGETTMEPPVESTAGSPAIQTREAKGFSFFKRKSKKPARTSAPISAGEEADAGSVTDADARDSGSAPAMPSFSSVSAEHVQRNEMLSGVEQEMLATRQLYLNGHISKDVYIAETRALYERAQQAE